MDLYQVLGVSKNSSLDEIKSSYKKMALKYHPDKNEGSEEANELFKEINEAYQILSNTEKRKEYDKYLFDMQNQSKIDGYTLISNAVDDCKRKEKEFERLVYKHLDLKWYQKLKNQLIAWAVVSLFIWGISNSNDNKNSARNFYTTIETAEIYIEPNNKSKIIYTANSGDDFEVIRKTKYFAEVKFKMDTTEKNGFILLEKLKER